tara:strand:+ start:84 stop:467 length:384 start_codon:yes stop_codon:yes gene_type:complete
MTTLERDIRLAYINTLLDGGYTLLHEGSENPTVGYIVGGARKGTTMFARKADAHFPEQFKEFMNLWIKTGAMCDADMDEGIGTWWHKGKIYFDVVQHFHDKDLATYAGNKRDEIAIWDCKNQKEITL